MAHLSLSKLKRLQAGAQALLQEKGEGDQRELTRWRKLAHFLARVYNSFIRNRCPIRAAALAYTTVLALIPLLAVAVSVSTSLLKNEGQKPINALINYFVANVAPALNLEESTDKEAAAQGREVVVRKIWDFINKVNSGTLGASAVLVLVFVAISLLSTIEDTFNDIWGVTRGRSWGNRVISYWAALTLGPLFVLTAFGITGVSQYQQTKAWIEHIELISRVFFFVLPFLILSATFSLFYLLMPNTKVNWRSAAVGGLVAGCLLQGNNLFNVMYVSRVVTYNKIYGSLSLVPLLLIGLYISWIIVLLGAQVAYAFQNRFAYVQEKQAEAVHQRGREFIALRLMTLLGQRFQSGEKPPTATDLAAEVGISLRLVSQTLGVLSQMKLVVEVAGNEIGYAPARPLDRISAHDVLQALRTGHGQDAPSSENSDYKVVLSQFEMIQAAERELAATVSLETLVRQLRDNGP